MKFNVSLIAHKMATTFSLLKKKNYQLFILHIENVLVKMKMSDLLTFLFCFVH